MLNLILAIVTACDPIDDRLKIVNDSNDTVYYLITEFENLERMYDPDLAANGINITYKNYVYELAGKASKKHVKTGSVKAWEDYIEKVCENKKLKVFIFDKEMLRSHSWKEIVEDGYFQERKSFSLDDIKDMDWEIVLE